MRYTKNSHMGLALNSTLVHQGPLRPQHQPKREHLLGLTLGLSLQELHSCTQSQVINPVLFKGSGGNHSHNRFYGDTNNTMQEREVEQRRHTNHFNPD